MKTIEQFLHILLGEVHIESQTEWLKEDYEEKNIG